MSLSSVRSETALRSRLFSSSRSFRRFTCSVFSPPNSWRHREYVTSLTPIWRIASAMGCPCETRTSTCRSFATISSGLYRFLAITVLLDVKDIPQVGPLQWGRISYRRCILHIHWKMNANFANFFIQKVDVQGRRRYIDEAIVGLFYCSPRL